MDENTKFKIDESDLIHFTDTVDKEIKAYFMDFVRAAEKLEPNLKKNCLYIKCIRFYAKKKRPVRPLFVLCNLHITDQTEGFLRACFG